MSETTSSASAHLAWCAMVALHTARKFEGICGDAQESLFLTRWLSDARKKKLFHRSAAKDLNWLLLQGRLLGPRARLSDKIAWLWFSCSGSLEQQSDMFCFTLALKKAGEQGWKHRQLSATEWSGRRASRLNVSQNGIYILNTSLDSAFADGGRQVNPLLARITGDCASLDKLFRHYGWQLEKTPDETPGHYLLTTLRQQD